MPLATLIESTREHSFRIKRPASGPVVVIRGPPMLQESPRPEVLRLQEQLGRVILGKPEVIDDLLIALLAGCHILMEDVPGVGKTTLAKAPAKSISSAFT